MGYEKEVVHPAMMTWLEQHGYIYAPEVPIRGAGRIDFVAIHAEKGTWLIECKCTCRGLNASIAQLLDYRDNYSAAAQVMLAVPESTITPQAQAQCTAEGITLLGLAVAPPEADANSMRRQSILIGFQAFEDTDQDLLDWWDSLPSGQRSEILRTIIRKRIHGKLLAAAAHQLESLQVDMNARFQTLFQELEQIIRKP